MRNAQDDGMENTWDDGVSIGNFWGDYSGTGLYWIAGQAQSVDRFPNGTIGDPIPPKISGPPDMEYKVGTVGHFLDWNISEEYPHEFLVLRNGSIVVSGEPYRHSLKIWVDGLKIGIYNYTLVISDLGGNYACDTVFVRVIPIEESTRSTAEEPTRSTADYSTFFHACISSILVVVVILYATRREWLNRQSA
jgi:hypothetical protein